VVIALHRQFVPVSGTSLFCEPRRNSSSAGVVMKAIDIATSL